MWRRFCQRFADLVKDKQLNRKLCRFSFYLNFSEGWTVHLKVQITCFHMWRSRLLVSSDDYLKFSSLKVLRILFQNPKADKNGRGEGCRAGAGGGLRVLQGWDWRQEGGTAGNRQAPWWVKCLQNLWQFSLLCLSAMVGGLLGAGGVAYMAKQFKNRPKDMKISVYLIHTRMYAQMTVVGK